MEVELENEKRALLKAQSERSSTDDKRLEQAQRELRKETEERQRVQAEAEEAEQRKTTLESRLEAFRNKLIKTKEQLADAQRRITEFESRHEVEDRQSPVVAKKAIKRSIAEVGLDASLGTPGDVRGPKRGKRAGSAKPGEQSNFSITPFLNRTGSIAPDSPESSPAKPPAPVGGVTKANGATKARVFTGNDASPRRPVPRSNTLKPAAVARTNTQPAAKRPTAKSTTGPKLAQVTEEEEGDENPPSISPERSGSGRSAPTGPKSASDRLNEQAVAKRRKLLSKTIFDDDDDAPIRPKPAGIFTGKLSTADFAKGPASRPFQFGANRGKPVASFGAFSPLKKDRKLAVA